MSEENADTTMPDKSKRMAAAAPEPKAKTGDVVVYWEGDALAVRQAVVLTVGADNSASLKVIMPATRKGGGGVARRENVAFADKAAVGCWGLG